MQNTELDTLAARMQQVLDRDYAHLDWKVLVQEAPHAETPNEPWVFVHARTRDVGMGVASGGQERLWEQRQRSASWWLSWSPRSSSDWLSGHGQRPRHSDGGSPG